MIVIQRLRERPYGIGTLRLAFDVADQYRAVGLPELGAA
jgi:hypothetical protein